MINVEARRSYWGFGPADRPIDPPFGAFYSDMGDSTIAQWDGQQWQVVGVGSDKTPTSNTDVGQPPWVGANRLAAQGYGAGVGGGGGVSPAPHTAADPPLTSAAPVGWSVADVAAATVTNNALAFGLTNVEQTIGSFVVGSLPATTTWLAYLGIVFDLPALVGQVATFRIKINGVLWDIIALSNAGSITSPMGPTDLANGDTIDITGVLDVGVANVDVFWTFSVSDVTS